MARSEGSDVTSGTHPRILDAAQEAGINPAVLAEAVFAYDAAMMGDPLAVERGIAAAVKATSDQIVWLRNQMGDVRGMQSDGATPEEMDHALGRALCGDRARLEFDRGRS